MLRSAPDVNILLVEDDQIDVRALQRAQQGTVADVTDAAGKKALGLP